MKKIGVYAIRNNLNGKIYVGSATKSFSHRWGMHISELTRGIHKNRYLQAAWIKYGQPSFDFSILEESSKEVAIEREQFWMDYFQSYKRDKGYNINELAKSRLGMTHEGKPKKYTEVFVFELNGIRKGWYPSVKHAAVDLGLDRRLISNCMKGIRKSTNKFVFTGIDKYPGYNRTSPGRGTWTKASKIKVGNTRRGRKRPEIYIPVKQFDMNGNIIKEYVSMTAAANAVKVSKTNISAACKNKRPSAGGFKWVC